MGLAETGLNSGVVVISSGFNSVILLYMWDIGQKDGLTYLQIRKPQSIRRIHAVCLELKDCACRFLRVHTLSVQTAMALIRLHECAG